MLKRFCLVDKKNENQRFSFIVLVVYRETLVDIITMTML